MIVHHSPRIEDLVRALAETVAAPVGPPEDEPLRREIIAVQGRGMERWLSMELSRRFGVWANPAFPFPRALIADAFDAVLGPGGEAARAFEPEAMVWTLAAVLPGQLGRASFAPLARFLRADENGDRLLQLAAQLSDLFDRYVVYRPEQVARWEAGADADDWQASLWREVVDRLGPGHLAQRARAFVTACESGSPGDVLPARASLFGLTTLPPLYVDVLGAMARHVELHLFVLQCASDPAADVASPLWHSLGGVGRDFHAVLASRRVLTRDAPSRSSSGAGRRSLLHAVQDSVRGPDSGPATGVSLDDSIAVHACYSPMREIEVLHDRLAALFEEDPALEPRDVVVMTPDIERYAPYVEAVFSAPARAPGERPRIPYRVADRRLRTTHDVVDAFGQVLDALSGRLPASAVVDLLLVDRVRRRFGIDAAEVDRLLAWIRDSGVRWGADAEHRTDFGQPALDQNTWRLGLDRLLLGLAMGGEPGGRARLFRGVLPAEGVAAGEAELLGRFCAFGETLLAWAKELHDPRPAPAWRDLLVRVLADLVDDADEGAAQHAALRGALDAIATRARDAGFEAPVPLGALRRLLDVELERGVPSHGFLAGGVTFCELVPMRSIPFRVTVLVGMNDGDFPRARQPLGFDRMARDPRPGDRDRREDDRYLFLEAIVSTRERLWITYTGHSARDGAEQAPAVVVDELLDAITDLLHGAGVDGEQVRARLVTRHPLHPFSPRYFDGSDERLVSFSGSDARGARALLGARAGRAVPRPFVREPLPLPPDAERTVSVSELARFFEHPVRGFLQRRLGLYLREEVEALRDREPIELDALERWQVADALLSALAGGEPGEAAVARLRAAGELPPGAPGVVVAREQLARSDRIATELRARRGGEALPPVPVDLEIEGWRLTGEVGEQWPAGRVEVQMSRLPHRRELSFWVRHLVQCVVQSALGQRGGPDSLLIGPTGSGKTERVRVLRLAAVPDAADRLGDLVRLYALGQEVPLPLLPKASLRQAEIRFGASGADVAWDPAPVQKAREDWQKEGGEIPPERDDPFLQQAFRDVDPLEPDADLPGGLCFGALAQRVWGPYLAAREVLK